MLLFSSVKLIAHIFFHVCRSTYLQTDFQHTAATHNYTIYTHKSFMHLTVDRLRCCQFNCIEDKHSSLLPKVKDSKGLECCRGCQCLYSNKNSSEAHYSLTIESKIQIKQNQLCQKILLSRAQRCKSRKPPKYITYNECAELTGKGKNKVSGVN